MISAHKETLSTTPELLVSSSGVDATIPRTVVLTGGSAADIYIGGPGVDSTTGYPVAQTTLTLLLGPGDDLWAVAGSGTPTINVLVTRADIDKGA